MRIWFMPSFAAKMRAAENSSGGRGDIILDARGLGMMNYKSVALAAGILSSGLLILNGQEATNRRESKYEPAAPGHRELDQTVA
jgi:hypothetical protein